MKLLTHRKGWRALKVRLPAFLLVLIFLTSCSAEQDAFSSPSGTAATTVTTKPTESPVQTQTMQVNAKQLDLYAKADTESGVVKTLARDEKLTVIINSGDAGFYPVVDENKSVIGYADQNKVVDENAVLYARVPYTKTIMNNKDGTTPTKDNVVDVREYAKDFEIYMILAHDDNFSGKAFYERDLCLLQKDTLDKLMAAQERVKKDGYRIKIYDAYRPQYVQGAMYKIVNNPTYIAVPTKASDHVRGTAVDITLVDRDGNELEMPSKMHTFGPSSGVNFAGMTETARKNMKYMQKIMLESGFLLYTGEWWHFKDSNFEQYNITSHHFNDIEMVVG